MFPTKKPLRCDGPNHVICQTMGSEKDFKKVVKAAEEQGWTAKKTKKGHWQLYAPDGKNIVHAAGTPSDHRSLENVLSQMRKCGFEWKGH